VLCWQTEIAERLLSARLRDHYGRIELCYCFITYFYVHIFVLSCRISAAGLLTQIALNCSCVVAVYENTAVILYHDLGILTFESLTIADVIFNGSKIKTDFTSETNCLEVS
jgi:hypothetical protein